MESRKGQESQLSGIMVLVAVLLITGLSDAWGIQLRDGPRQDQHLGHLHGLHRSENPVGPGELETWPETRDPLDNISKEWLDSNHEVDSSVGKTSSDKQLPPVKNQVPRPATSSSAPADENTSAGDDSTRQDPPLVEILSSFSKGPFPVTPTRSIAQLLSKLEADYQVFSKDVAELQQGLKSLAAVSAKVADTPGIKSSHQSSEDPLSPGSSSSRRNNSIHQVQSGEEDPRKYHISATDKDAQRSLPAQKGSFRGIIRPNPSANNKELAVTKAMTSRGSRRGDESDPRDDADDIAKQEQGYGSVDSSDTYILENKRNLAPVTSPTSNLAEYEAMIELLIRIASEREEIKDDIKIPAEDSSIRNSTGTSLMSSQHRTPAAQPIARIMERSNPSIPSKGNKDLLPTIGKASKKSDYPYAKEAIKGPSDESINLQRVDDLPRFAYHIVPPPAGILFPSRTSILSQKGLHSPHSLYSSGERNSEVTTAHPKPIMAISIASPVTLNQSKNLHFLHTQLDVHHGQHHKGDEGKETLYHDVVKPKINDRYLLGEHSASTTVVQQQKQEEDAGSPSNKETFSREGVRPAGELSMKANQLLGVVPTKGPSVLIDRLDKLLQKLHSNQQKQTGQENTT